MVINLDIHEYASMCQMASMCKKSEIDESLLIEYDGVKYIPYSYELLFKKGKPIHRANVLSLESNCLVSGIVEKMKKGGAR